MTDQTKSMRFGSLQAKREGRVITPTQDSVREFRCHVSIGNKATVLRHEWKGGLSGHQHGVAPLAAVGVSRMGAQGANALDDCGKPAKGGPNVAGHQRVEVARERCWRQGIAGEAWLAAICNSAG